MEQKLNKCIQKIKDIHKRTCDIYIIKDLQMYYQDLELIADWISWADKRDSYYINEKLDHINKVLNRIIKEMY